MPIDGLRIDRAGMPLVDLDPQAKAHHDPLDRWPLLVMRWKAPTFFGRATAPGWCCGLPQGQALDSPRPITAGPQPWLGPMVRTRPGAIAVFMTWEGLLTDTMTEYGYAVWASLEEGCILFLASAKSAATIARLT